ncbi:hypothetical protein [Leptospira phage LE4]|uniref:Uncharacterized protein n=1 Tax=Leptospira phage LE4 TaxID=2041383 RepID=A0A343LEC0_9CAUD|nr:hypothetical protein HWB34_gp17 [Leptospira phage LE4]ATN95030.1 hypothetical protein [Leptospira phage LE4]
MDPISEFFPNPYLIVKTALNSTTRQFYMLLVKKGHLKHMPKNGIVREMFYKPEHESEALIALKTDAQARLDKKNK